MDLIGQLNEFYYKYDQGQTSNLSEEEITEYNRVLLEKRAIVYILDEDKLLGYCEYWCINPEQLNRVLRGIPVNIKTEDIETGSICYVHNVTVHPNARMGKVAKELKRMLFERTKSAIFYTGYRHKNGIIKLFRKR